VVRLSHCKAGAAPATVSEIHERRTPLCTAREGAVRGMWFTRTPLASPETGPNDSWWLAVGEAEPRVWRFRLPVVPSFLPSVASSLNDGAVRGCAAEEPT
jgi:hypothetical protein